MDNTTHPGWAVVSGVLITVISAIFVWVLRRVAAMHPPTNGKALEKIQAEIRHAIAEAEEMRKVRETLHRLEEESSQLVIDMKFMRDRVHEMHLRIERIEETA